jgi:exodeoxyribonuclease VII large subunit
LTAFEGAARVDLATPQASSGNVPEITVSELSGALKRTIEDRFGLVRVRGEISNYRGPHGSGHAYFCLKDDAARIDAVIWRTSFLRLKTKPQEGLEVIATGRVTTYPGKSTYQIVIESIEPAGVGALMALLESRRKALAAEGLFDSARKRALPFLPTSVGVVTSPTGAVIRDILHRIADRFPRNVLVWPVRVQGETAAEEVAAAIAGFEALPAGLARPDVLIVARGGGSLEDLWAFNEEIVVRAAAACGIPLIAAIGHETDWTLIDHVADLRAPTPSGAAEKAVPVRVDLVEHHGMLAIRHRAGMTRLLDRRRGDLRSLARALPTRDSLVSTPRQRLDSAAARLASALATSHDRQRLDLARLTHRLSRQTPHARLAQQRHQLDSREQRMIFCLARGSERRRDRIAQLGDRLATVGRGLGKELGRREETRQRLATSLAGAWATMITTRRERCERLEQLLSSLGYRQVLARGFALVRDGKGRPLRGIADAPPAGLLDIEFVDGHIETSVGIVRKGRPARAASRIAPGQGALF